MRLVFIGIGYGPYGIQVRMQIAGVANDDGGEYHNGAFQGIILAAID